MSGLCKEFGGIAEKLGNLGSDVLPVAGPKGCCILLEG